MLKNSRWVLVVCCALTLLFQLYLCFFFSDAGTVPTTGDHNPSTYTRWRFELPADGFFNRDYWYGFGNVPVGLDPLGLLTWLPTRAFFTSTFGLCAVVLILGFYRLGRELGLRREVSAVGGMFLAWQGDYLGFVSPGHYGNAPQWALVPWMFWLGLRALRTSGGAAASGKGAGLAGIAWRSWYAAALCGGVGGAIVSLLVDRGGLFTLLLAGMFFYEAWQRNRMGDVRRRMQPILLLVVVTLFAVLTAAPTLVATWKLSGSDTIKGGSDDPAQKYAWATSLSMPPEEIFTYFVPGFYGWSTGHESGPYWGRVGSQEPSETGQKVRNFSLGSAVIGTIPFGLALLGMVALYRRRGKHGNRELREELDLADETAVRLAWYFAGALVVTLLLAMGKYTPVHWLFYQLPLQEHWRNPIKFQAPCNLCIAYMAAISLQWIAVLVQRRSALTSPILADKDQTGAAPEVGAPVDELAVKRFASQISPVMIFVMGLTGALVALFVLFLLPAAMALSELLSAIGYRIDVINAAVGTARSTLLAASVSAGMLLTALHMGFYPERWRGLEIANPSLQNAWVWALDNANRTGFVLMLVGIVSMLQMCWMHSQNLTPVSSLVYTKPNEAVDFVKHDSSIFRVSVLGDDPMGHRRLMLGFLFPANGIMSIDNSAISRTPRDYAAYFQAVHDNLQRHYFLGGVKYVFGMPSITDGLHNAPLFKNIAGGGTYMESMKNPQNDEPYGVMEMRDYMAKVTLVRGVEVFDDQSKLLTRLPDPRWNPRHTALVMKSDAARLPDLASMRRSTPTPLSSPMPEVQPSNAPTPEAAPSAIPPAPPAPSHAPAPAEPAAASGTVPSNSPATNVSPSEAAPTSALTPITNTPGRASGSGGSSPDAPTNLPPSAESPALAPIPISIPTAVPATTAPPAPGAPTAPQRSSSLAAPAFHMGTSTGSGQVSLTRFDEHATAFQATAQEPVIAVINDHYEAEWIATVNGRPVPVVRVNQIMMGIPLPAGTSSVVVRYAPSSLPAYVGLGTWIALLLFGAGQLLIPRASMPQAVASSDHSKTGKKQPHGKK
ncbi:MAG TPA: hypothetical protein VK970_20300 [Candidatus Methylacidiphilales bacterium]|nr:hypothetical protein [Candidatus Methylacidiphilales bacterium]